MIYLSPHTIRKGRVNCRMIWYDDKYPTDKMQIYYSHYLQDFALSKLDISPHHEQQKGGHLEHYLLTGPEEISKALKAGAVQLTTAQYRAILKKKRKMND